MDWLSDTKVSLVINGVEYATSGWPALVIQLVVVVVVALVLAAGVVSLFRGAGVWRSQVKEK